MTSRQVGLPEYSLVALYNLGGGSMMVDIEDVALEALRLAPLRFRWRRHELPNLELVRVALRDANRGDTQLVLTDETGHCRMLTVEGSARAVSTIRRIEFRVPAPESPRRKDAAELTRLEGHQAYRKWLERGINSVDALDLADVARCPLSTPASTFSGRLQRYRSIAAYWERFDLARFLQEGIENLPKMLEEEV